MRVHLPAVPASVTRLERQMLTATLHAHYRILMLGFVGSRVEPEEAERLALDELQKYANEAFPDLPIEILPDAKQ